MHGLKCRINCTRTRTLQPDYEAEAERVDAVAAAASAALPPRDITVGGFGVDSENPEVR